MKFDAVAAAKGEAAPSKGGVADCEAGGLARCVGRGLDTAGGPVDVERALGKAPAKDKRGRDREKAEA